MKNRTYPQLLLITFIFVDNLPFLAPLGGFFYEQPFKRNLAVDPF